MRGYLRKQLLILLAVLVVIEIFVAYNNGGIINTNSKETDQITQQTSSAIAVNSYMNTEISNNDNEETTEQSSGSGEKILCQSENLKEILIAEAVSLVTGIEISEHKNNLFNKILVAGLPWNFDANNEDDVEDLVFNYAAGDESSYYWNQNSTSDNPLVAIYSTHSAESYTPYSGQQSVSGQRGGVYVASSVVAETLAKKNIGTIVDDTIHDYPNWNKSYSNSLVTARNLLDNNPSLKIIIDMHRDGGVSKENTTAEINGKSAARIMFVVGSNQRYEHPYWEQNLAFAQKIGDKMEEMYPGLLRTVKVQNGRYNQQVSTHSILVEMGATENTIEEVEYSSVLLANVLAEILKEME
jgi:stage II sporulation protein P